MPVEYVAHQDFAHEAHEAQDHEDPEQVEKVKGNVTEVSIPRRVMPVEVWVIAHLVGDDANELEDEDGGKWGVLNEKHLERERHDQQDDQNPGNHPRGVDVVSSVAKDHQQDERRDCGDDDDIECSSPHAIQFPNGLDGPIHESLNDAQIHRDDEEYIEHTSAKTEIRLVYSE